MNFVQPIREKEKIKDVRTYLRGRNQRDELLFCFGIYTGLRISDILKLKVKDVTDKKVIFVKEQKTLHTRKRTKRNGPLKSKRIPITTVLEKLIRAYTDDKKPEEYLFKSRQGKNSPITRIRAYEILRQAARENELSEIGTHTMRKTFGYHMYYQNDKDVALVQDLLGHSDPYITMKYIGVSQDAIEQAYNKLKY